MGVRNQIAALWNRQSGDRAPLPAEQTTSGEAYGDYSGDKSTPATDFIGYYADPALYWLRDELNVRQSRIKNLKLYREIDEEYTEVSSALDLYADNVTQVGINQDKVVHIVSKDEGVRRLLAEVVDRLRLDQRAWALARALARDGEVFEEVVVGEEDLRLDRLKKLPTTQMLRNEDKFGLLDKKQAFIQLDPDYVKVLAKFQDWEVIHYRLQRDNEDRYGTSILHSIRKVYKQMQMIEESMILARLTRANSRLVYFVDVGNLPPKQAEEHVKAVKAEFRKRKLFDPRSGRLRDDANPMTAEEDIFLPTRQGSPADVKQLVGDFNIGNLDDVEFFHSKIFAGLKAPKSYLGFEKDVGGKNVLTQQDIQFARSVRRLQLAQTAGYRQLLDLAWILEGKRGVVPEYKVVLPFMKTIDEMREWEMKRIQSEVARIWSQELWLDPVAVLQEILGFSEEHAKRLYQGQDSDFAGQADSNRAKAFRAAEDKRFAQKVREAVGSERIQALRELSEWALEARELEEAQEKGEAA